MSGLVSPRPTGSTDLTTRSEGSPGDAAMRRAWWSLALFPVAFVAAFVIGEGLFAWLDDGVGDAAIWVIAVSGLPAIIAGTLVAAFVGINLLSFIAMVIFG